MFDTKRVLEELDKVIAIADRSDKINRNYVVGRVICDNIDLVRALLENGVDELVDAERYRWVRASGDVEIYLHNQPGIDNCKQVAGEGLDIASDAAIKKENTLND